MRIWKWKAELAKCRKMEVEKQKNGSRKQKILGVGQKRKVGRDQREVKRKLGVT